MAEWRSYSLEDFLLFAPRTYWRLFELHNTVLWPLHLATVALGLAVLALILFRPGAARRAVPLVLAAAWAFVAWSFLLARYEAINWAAAYATPAFLLQAALLLGAAALPRGFHVEPRDAVARAGLCLALAGLLLYPVLPPLFGRGWTHAETFGLAPDPTAIVTLGLLLATRGWLLAVLLPVPLLWCLFSGLTLLAMDDTQAWLLFGAPALTLALLAARLKPGHRAASP